MLGLMLLLWVVLSLSLLLFVIPFFFVLPRLVLSPYYLVNQNLGPIAALKASWEKTKGHSGKVWGIIGVNILFVLLCVTIIGIPVALYLLFMYASASPVLYYWINRQSTQPAVAAAPTPVQ
jgi:membrane-anchored glycerophosphoryl diester phosphodiesterase (GDPDase)